MSSKREEERNEKIIRGLLKLPPNRRCINCNSLGPQYVCTNFWTFVCITCGGIHREFTHRVKSVSMAKFTFQEVDALQKGGNQRARELFLKSWDPQRNRLPDNSNVDKVRSFIKSVYVDNLYSKEKSSDKPPRDPQSLRNHEDETRRASSYHSYSQSPPYDYQYEERRYGKHAPSLTRKPGSDRGLYEGKLASFLSPTHLSDDGFANEGSHHRASDYSISGGGDPFRSEALSPVSQRDFGSPSSENSRDISGEVPELHTTTHNSDANVKGNSGRMLPPQRTMSTGSYGSIDSNFMSFKSIHSLPEFGSGPEYSAEVSLEKSLSLPPQPQSFVSQTFGGLDLFGTPISQNTDKTPQAGSNSQFQPAVSTQPVNVDTQQQPSQLQPPPLDLFAALSQEQSPPIINERASDAVTPNSGGWATFDVPQSVASMGAENSATPIATSSDGNVFGSFNPFISDQNSQQNFTDHKPFVPENAFGHGSLQNVDASANHSDLQWNAFDDSTGEQLNPNSAKNNEAAAHCTSDANRCLGFGAHELGPSVLNQMMSNDSFITTNEIKPPPSGLSSHFSMEPSDFVMTSAVGNTYSFAADLKTTNPFDMLYDSNMESGNMSQVWDVGLPTVQMPPITNVGANDSWFPENSIPSYGSVSSGVPFESTTGSLGFMAGQVPYSQIPNIHGQGPVASIGGNPFA